MNIIGITGKAQSGKDTVSRLLLSQLSTIEIDEDDYVHLRAYEELANIVSFAYPVYRALAAIFKEELMLKGCRNELQAIEWLMTHKNEQLGSKTVRQLLQTLGTEWGRHMIDVDLWVNIAKNRIIGLLEQANTTVIVPDVRFENEAELVRTLGGVLLHINREVEQLNHASEKGVKFKASDIAIDNTGTLDDLDRQVKELYQRLCP